MLKRAVSLSVLLMITCACTKYEPVPYYAPPACYVPTRPQLQKLDEAEHIASPANMERLVLMVIDQDAHIKRLDSAIECFRQSGNKTNTEGELW